MLSEPRAVIFSDERGSAHIQEYRVIGQFLLGLSNPRQGLIEFLALQMQGDQGQIGLTGFVADLNRRLQLGQRLAAFTLQDLN